QRQGQDVVTPVEVAEKLARGFVFVEVEPERLGVVNYAHARGARIERHLDLAESVIFFESQGRADSHFRFTFVDERDQRLLAAKAMNDGFEGEDQSLLKPG